MTTRPTSQGPIRRLRVWVRSFTPPKGGVDIGAVATRHLFRGHQGEALLCQECVEDSR